MNLITNTFLLLIGVVPFLIGFFISFMLTPLILPMATGATAAINMWNEIYKEVTINNRKK